MLLLVDSLLLHRQLQLRLRKATRGFCLGLSIFLFGEGRGDGKLYAASFMLHFVEPPILMVFVFNVRLQQSRPRSEDWRVAFRTLVLFNPILLRSFWALSQSGYT